MLRYIQDLLKEMDSHKLRSLKLTDIMKVRGGGGVWEISQNQLIEIYEVKWYILKHIYTQN